DVWGGGTVFSVALAIISLGAIASAFVTKLWHLYVASGVLMALGAGGGTLTPAIPLIARWFDKHRGLAIGIAGAAMSAGQLVMIPLATWLTLTVGWRKSYVWLGLGLFVLILPLAVVFIRTDPRDERLEPYGATPARPRAEAAPIWEARRS